MYLGLFIDVGTNYSVLDHTNLSFIYEDVLSPGPNNDGEFVSSTIIRLIQIIKCCKKKNINLRAKLNNCSLKLLLNYHIASQTH